MNTANVLLAVMAGLVSATALAILFGEYQPVLREFRSKAKPLTQMGDTSLSRHSVNWLAATAFSTAVFICFVLM